MNRYSADYKDYYTKELSRTLRKLSHFAKAIEKKIVLLLKNPYKNCKSELLVGNLKGFRSARLTKSIRIIFVICEECREHGWQKYIQCSPSLCITLSPKTVVFLSIGIHNKIYRIRPLVR